MTHYVLREGLSFCRVDGRLVFLDIDNDRYFRLPDLLAQALTSYLDGNGTADPHISRLVEQNILVPPPGTAVGGRQDITRAARSAMEAPLPAPGLRPRDLLEVLATVLRTRLALQVRTLKLVLDGVGAHRRLPPAQASPDTAAAATEHRLCEATSLFRRARLFVPVEMCCLLDSLALAAFLRRRQLRSQIVFGVALDPFSAHCWVQAGDLVLNDTVGNVNSHTPIRVV